MAQDAREFVLLTWHPGSSADYSSGSHGNTSRISLRQIDAAPAKRLRRMIGGRFSGSVRKCAAPPAEPGPHVLRASGRQSAFPASGTSNGKELHKNPGHILRRRRNLPTPEGFL